MAASVEHPTTVALPRTGIRSVSVHLILTAISMLLLMFSFAPWGWWWLAYFALVPAGMLAARASSAKRLLWTSFAVFWVGWLVMIQWIIPISYFAYAALSALMAFYWALALVLTHQLHHRYRCAMVVLLPMAWVASEWVRGRFLAGGFSWFMLGHSQADYEIGQPAGRLIQFADVFGVLGVSLVVAMTSGLVIDLLTRPIMKPTGKGKHKMHPTARGSIVLWLIVTVGAHFYGEYRIGQWSDTSSPGPRIAVIQTNVPQDNKIFRTPEQDLQDWRDLVALTREAAATEPTPDIIVWPETMVPTAINPEAVEYFIKQDTGGDVYHESIRQLALQTGCNLLVGAAAYEGFVSETLDSGEAVDIPKPRYNSAYHYYSDGEQAPLRYDKTHRVPFGEYIPWVGAIPPLKSLFIKLFTPYTQDYSLGQGEARTVFELPVMVNAEAEGESDEAPPTVVRVVTPICYEDAVGRDVRRLVYESDGSKRADLIVNLTNSAWYCGYSQQPQHLQIATIRSIENRVPMARSVNGGISGFIDSLGRVSKQVEVGGQRQWVSGFAVDAPRLDDRSTVYGRLGDLPAGCLALVAGFLFVWGKIVPRKHRD